MTDDGPDHRGDDLCRFDWMHGVRPALLTTGRHKGLVVWFTPEEFDQMWAGVDRDAAELLGKPEEP